MFMVKISESLISFLFQFPFLKVVQTGMFGLTATEQLHTCGEYAKLECVHLQVTSPFDDVLQS